MLVSFVRESGRQSGQPFDARLAREFEDLPDLIGGSLRKVLLQEELPLEPVPFEAGAEAVEVESPGGHPFLRPREERVRWSGTGDRRNDDLLRSSQTSRLAGLREDRRVRPA